MSQVATWIGQGEGQLIIMESQKASSGSIDYPYHRRFLARIHVLYIETSTAVGDGLWLCTYLAAGVTQPDKLVLRIGDMSF